MEKVSLNRAHVRGPTFQTFLQALKNEQLDNLLAKMIKFWTKCVLCVVLIKQ